MSESQKPTTPASSDNILRYAFNTEDKSLSTSSFVAAFVGRKIQQAISTTTVANDTLVLTYSENGSTLYVLKVVYTDGTRSTFLSVERIA